MNLTTMKKSIYTAGVTALGFLLGGSSCFASLTEIVRPIETKASDVSTALVWIFWAVVGAVLTYRVALIVYGNENNRPKHMIAIAWLVGGAIFIASIAKFIAWMKAAG